MKKLLLSLSLLFPLLSFAQGLYNNGATIVVTTGAYLYVDGDANGNYVNAAGGQIDIDGTMILEGDFTNTSANNVFKNVDADGEVVFAGATQTITSALPNYTNFEKVTINSGSTTSLVAASGMTTNGVFDIDGTFNVETPADESIGGSLKTLTGAAGVTGTGTLNINRFFKINARWQYISSPITGQQSDIFTESTVSGNFNPNFYSYNETYDEPVNPTDINYSNYDYGSGYGFWQAWVQEQAAAGAPVALADAVGYITYSENNITANFTTNTPSDINNAPSYSPAITFTQNDGNGNFYDGWNLIGNPYQSALDWDDANWTKTNISNTVYMWDGDAGNYVYYNNGFGDELQGVGQTLNSDGNARYIPAMQSFMIKVTAAAPALTIPSQARVHNSNQMYKGADIPVFDFIKLQTEVNEQKDQTLIRFLENSNESIEDEYDAYKAFSTTPGLPQLYSLVEKVPVAINTLPVDEYTEYKKVPLGIVAKQNGEYTFSATDFYTNHFDKLYFIEQTAEKIIYTDLTITPNYSVYLEEGEYKDRFYLLAVTNAVDIEDLTGNESNVNIYSYGYKVFISIPNSDFLNGTVDIYDALGRNIFKNQANSTFNEYELNVAPGTYIVKYITQAQTFIKKISIN
ncbi:MAG: T9SS type A sorting domain-containing protein [Bacteroidales bacterium]|nr:T9SS type A sorting domain-containing protein [Bacteroidales bacterium]